MHFAAFIRVLYFAFQKSAYITHFLKSKLLNNSLKDNYPIKKKPSADSQLIIQFKNKLEKYMLTFFHFC